MLNASPQSGHQWDLGRRRDERTVDETTFVERIYEERNQPLKRSKIVVHNDRT